MPTLCLTMIVKNETKVLPRCFDSIVKYLDYWNIHDTGSTDGTPEYIKNYFKEKGIPGKLYHTPWKNFGYNRSQAVKTAKNKADYTILFDADFTLIVKDEKFKDKLMADAYLIKYEGGLDYRQTLLVKTRFDWKYIGVTHEYIHCPEVKNIQIFDGFTIKHLADGGCRSDKFERDIQLLTDGIAEEPDNQRYYFYLAQSYKDIGKFDDAIPYYQKRVEFGGWGEEVYYSLYQIGLCKLRRNDSLWEFMGDLLRAYFYRPQRLESLYHLIRYCRLNKMPQLGYQLGKMAINNDYPKDLLFIEKPIHDWLFLDEVALCAFMSGKFKRACGLGRRILNEQKYQGEAEKKRLEQNMAYYKQGYEQFLRNGGQSNMKNQPINSGELQGNSISGVAAPRQQVTSQQQAISQAQMDQIKSRVASGQAEDVTVVIYINELRPVFEIQLGALLQQTVTPAEIWVVISNKVELNQELTGALQKFNRVFPNLKALKIKGDDYDGRLRVISQIKTKWVSMYDDNRLPNPKNLAYYLKLVKDKPELEKAILGQWGWQLHPPRKENGVIVSKWEIFPDINQSKFLMNDNRSGDLVEVDYLCGHWFTTKDNLLVLAREHDQKTLRLSKDTEDIIFSLENRLKRQVKTYKCCPTTEEEGLTYNCGGMQDPINYEILTQRSDLIKMYCLDDYQMVCDSNPGAVTSTSKETPTDGPQPMSDLDKADHPGSDHVQPPETKDPVKKLFALSSQPTKQFNQPAGSFKFQFGQSEKTETKSGQEKSDQEKKKDQKQVFKVNGQPDKLMGSVKESMPMTFAEKQDKTSEPKVQMISDVFSGTSNGTKEVRMEDLDLTKYAGQKIVFFCPDYTSMGGSEFTIKTLYDRVSKEVIEKDGQVIITTNIMDVLQFKPNLMITQQRAIGLAIQLCSQMKIRLWIMVHGPGQYRPSPQCDLVIYNSQNLLEQENPQNVKKMVYHPAIDLNRYKIPKNKKKPKYITFVGSTSYNYLKGCDLFVELARAMPDHQFKYVGPVEEIDYNKNYFLVGQMPKLTPDHYDPKNLPKNLVVVKNTPEIEQIYAETKILVVPSLVESYGRVAVEAAAAGVPVVCSGLLGLKEATYGLAEYVEAYRQVPEFKKSIEKVEKNYDQYVSKTEQIIQRYQTDEEKSFNEFLTHL